MATGTRQERSVRFGSTRWSVILRCAAGVEDPAQNQGALEEFCKIYWSPVYAFLLRRGYPPADAQDLAQGFFVHLLEHQSYAAADPFKGRFRTFLVVALKNFLADHCARERTIKRGGEYRFLALTPALVSREPQAFVAAEAGGPGANGAEGSFDRQWAVTLVERTLSLLGAELAEEGRGELFAALQPLLGLGDLPLPKLEEVARVQRMPAGTLRTHLHRLRGRYRGILRAEVARTVAGPSDVEGELRHLFQILTGR